MRLAIVAVALVAASGCASLPPGHVEDPRDPIELVNRNVFEFNKELDETLLQPAARAYKFVVAEPLRDAISNFFSNLGEPLRAVYHLLQGEVSDSANAVGRFAINTTIGVLGLGDPATEAGLERTNEDLGLTLGHYGAGPGPYLMLPFFGPTTIRDVSGRVVDISVNPIEFAGDLTPAQGFATRGVQLLNGRAKALDLTDRFMDLPLDPYVAVRNAYLSDRAKRIAESRGEKLDETLPTYDDPTLP